MRNTLAIFQRELRAYFASPIVYVMGAIFLLITGAFFYLTVRSYAEASLRAAGQPFAATYLNSTDIVFRPIFANVWVIMLLMMPLLTMRLIAEERRAGTIELLLTYPIRDGAVLAGKYLAALALYAMMIGLTLAYPAMVAYFAQLEWGPLLTGYLGLLLMGAAFLAVGLFAYIAIWERHGLSSGELDDRRAQLVPAFVRERVSEVSIDREGGRIVLVRERAEEEGELGDWTLKEPVEGAADFDAVDSLLGAIEWATPLRRLEGISAADRERFGFVFEAVPQPLVARREAAPILCRDILGSAPLQVFEPRGPPSPVV